MKKTLVMLLSACLLSMSFSACNSSEKPPITDTTQTTVDHDSSEAVPNPASDFEYEINSNQTGVFVNKYIGSTEHVVIPSEINGLPVLSLNGVTNKNDPTTVDEGVFEGSSIKTVVIPQTIKAIGAFAFGDCKELTQVTISPNSSLTYINFGAFESCVNLERIDLSATQVKAIDMLAFRGCTNLTEIKFPATLEEIREKAFYECSSLLEIVLPQNLTKINGGAFAYCTSLQRVVIPTKLNLSSFSEAIFHNVPSLQEIVFEEGREGITGYALFQTDASVEIIVPKGIKTFSPLTFLINPSTDITITFLGDAPEIQDEEADWFGNPTIYYDPTTNGWDTFTWNNKFEVRPIQEN